MNSNPKFNVFDRTIIKQNSQQAEVSVVHHKSAASRDSQISRHTSINDSSPKDVQHRREEKRLSDKYSQYCHEVVDPLYQFQSVKDGHLHRINIEKHRIKLFHKNLLPVSSAPYLVGPKTRV